MQTIKEEFKARVPFYIFLIFTFCFAIWSVVLPILLGLVDNASAVAASFATPSTIDTAVTNSDSQLFYVNNAYYSFYTTGSANNHELKVASSSDGNTWGTPVSIDTGINATSTLQAKYHAGASLLTAIYYDDSSFPVIATSTNGTTWVTSSASASAAWGEVAAYVTDPSSGFAAIFLQNNTSKDIEMVTTSLPTGTWTDVTTTVHSNIAATLDGGLIGAEMDSSGVIHVALYEHDSSDNNPTGRVVYASSSDYGYTWTEVVIDSGLSSDDLGGGNYINYTKNTAFALDGNNNPAIVYMRIDDASMSGFNTTSTLVYAKKASGSWTTSTIDTEMRYGISMTQSWSTRPGLKFFSTDNPIISYTRQDSNVYPTFADKTTGSFVTTSVASEASQDFESGNVNIAYDTVNSNVGITYINTSGVFKFTTSSFALAAAPNAPTSIAVDESSITTTALNLTWADNSSDEDGFALEYSTDNSTWVGETLVAANATTGSLSGLSASTAYYFRVSAYNATGTSTYSTTSDIKYTFGDNTIKSVATSTYHDLLYVDGVYSLFYADDPSVIDTFNIYVVTSTNAESWSSEVTVLSGISHASNSQVTFNAQYSTSSNYYAVTAANGDNSPVFTTSSDTTTWSTPVVTGVVGSAGAGNISIGFASSSGYALMAYYDSGNDLFKISTSTDGNSWTASTLRPGITGQTNHVIGVGVTGPASSEILHVAYIMEDSSDGNPLGDIYYASSTNNGVSWTSTTVAINTGFNLGGGQYLTLKDMTDFVVDDNGYLGLIYTQVDNGAQVAGLTYNVSTTMVLATSTVGSGTWATSSIESGGTQKDLSGYSKRTPNLEFFGSGNPIFTYYDWVTGYPTLGYSTTTQTAAATFTTSSLGSYSIAHNTDFSTIYDTVDEWAVSAYVYGSNLDIVTSSVALPTAPTAPSGIGISSVDSATSISISWTDNASDETSYTVEYSTDGASWTVFSTPSADAMLATITGLTANTAYYFRIAAVNGVGTSAYSTTGSTTYTLANVAGTPTIGTPTTSVLPLTIDVNSNPAATTFALYNVTDSNYIAADGSDNGATPVYQTNATWGSDFNITGLSLNTAYTFKVYARNGDSTATAASTASASTYTLAAAPGTPTIGTPTATTLPITITTSSNPAATTYAVYNETDDNYLAADGSDNGSTAVYSTTSTLTSSFAATGLTANTSYTFWVIARNGDNTETASSTTSAEIYTAANVPSSLSATGGTEQVALSWSGDATTYAVQNVTDASVTSFAAETTLTVSSLTCGTSYTFKVKGANADDVETAYSSTVTESTSACASSGGGGSTQPGSVPVSSPSLPSSEPAASTVPSSEIVGIGKSTPVTVAGSVHTVTVLDASSNSVEVEVRSEPVLVTIKKGETQEVDVDNNGTKDLRVTYIGLVSGKPELVLAEILDESVKAVTINKGAAQTLKRDVSIKLNVKDVVKIAVSEDPTFAGSSFENYVTSKKFILSEGHGLKTIYVRFRNAQGGIVDASDNISYVSTLVEEVVETDNGCILDVQKPYKSVLNNSVYYVTKDCTKRAFNSANKYFTYFTSWNDVTTVSNSILKNISQDKLGFMPWGPLYDPQYGAVVKVVTDPKTYLLLGGERKWFISETVFKSLGYAWSWVEDIDERLLNKFKVGGEISDLSKHPDHTLIKYKDSNKVYKLENGKKRHIKNEAAFNKLKYRWDRIVTIKDTEVYPDGEQLN